MKETKKSNNIYELYSVYISFQNGPFFIDVPFDDIDNLIFAIENFSTYHDKLRDKYFYINKDHVDFIDIKKTKIRKNKAIANALDS